MKLSKIKSTKDEYVTKYVLKEMELIKKHFGFSKNSKIFYLGYYNSREYFLYKNTVFVTFWDAKKEEKGNLDVNTMHFLEFFSVKMLNDLPKTLDDVEFTEITDILEPKLEYHPKYTVEDFLAWITQPCNLTNDVDIPYYKVIDFLKTYSVTDFRYDDYQFYIKRDKDFSFMSNINVKNLKTKKEVKLYFPYKCIEDENEGWIGVPPTTPRDIVLDDLSGRLNNYQKLKIKKAYLEFSKIFNKEFKVTNHYVLELLKQTILPVEINCGIGLHRIFCSRDRKFTNIWVNDFPSMKEEPAFFLTDTPYFQTTTKIAFLNFKSATYHTTGIYKQLNYKRNPWKLDKNYLKELTEFLKSPVDSDDYAYRVKRYQKHVKTNWQHLIYEYNHNSAGWGWNEDDSQPVKNTKGNIGIELLPFDLPIPDYTKLAEV